MCGDVGVSTSGNMNFKAFLFPLSFIQHSYAKLTLDTRAAWTWINPIHLIWIWIWIGFGLDLDFILILSLDWIGFWIQNIS